MRKRRFKTQFDKRPVKDGVFPGDEKLPGDGEDPKYDTDVFPKKVVNRKALQLCEQVRNALNVTFPSLADGVLIDLYVDSVIPAPDSSHLLATVVTGNDVDTVRQHIHNASGLLRSEIATCINRKRVPQITYVVRQ